MGGAFSTGQDNDELVDNLVDACYIRSKKIEQVFRAVDRGDYFLSCERESAYKDFAWKHGNIHLSAPCIYCEVMEELALKPGLSFLNLGSGTGYLSTMAGLLLTQTGINHGIELHEDCVRYSYDRLEEFKQKSLALDEFDFCEPMFVQGNCLNITPGRRYDRVYCGATCPESHEALIKEFIKVGGILVMPCKDHLVKVTRIDESTWEQENVLPVSFANLVIPTSTDSVPHLPDCDPLSLQELCRGKIRRRLRQNVWSEHTDLETRKPISAERHQPKPHKALRQYVIPIFEESDENRSDDDEESRVHWTQLLLNVDSPPGENLRTTLQFVRADYQNRGNNAGDTENEDINWPEDEDEYQHSTEEDTPCDTNVSSERDRRDSESSSDSACEQSHSESNNLEVDGDKFDGRPRKETGLPAYSHMSESESDEGDEVGSEEQQCSPERQQNSSSPASCKKTIRKDKSDSGIVEDCNAGNDEANLSSDSEFANGTPVKHKRSSSSPCSRTNGIGSNNNNHNGNNNNNSGSSESNSNKRSRLKKVAPSCPYTGHYVDTNAFSSYMKEKIHQLPLPYSLKLYINYNRNL